MKLINFLQNIGDICGLAVPAELTYDSSKLLQEHINDHTRGAKPLCRYLNYRYFDPKSHIFFNDNQVIGFMLEIAPIVGSDVNLEKNLSLFFNNELPVNCHLQFLLIASHNIEQKLNLWSRARSNSNQMLQQLTALRREFISKCAKNFTNLDGRMAKDFRIYVSFSKKSEGNNSIKSIEEVTTFQSKLVKKLHTIKLSPRICDAQDLIFVVGDIAQMQMQQRLNHKYDPINPLANQILTPFSRTMVTENALVHLDNIYNDNKLKSTKLAANQLNKLVANKLVSKCFYPSLLPEQWSLLEMINLLGSASDHVVPARLIISYTVANNVSKTQSSKILARGHRSIHAAEQWYTRHDTNLKKEALEWREIIAKAKNGEQFLTEVMQIMITAPESEIEIAQESLISLYNSLDFQLQNNQNLQLPAMLSILPMNQAVSWSFLQHFQLVKLAQAKEVIAKLPIHGEWKGVNHSGVLLVGRRGELFNWNPFVRINSGNYNLSVMAPSGSGKSVFLQELATTMLAQNTSVFILDIGGSYQNICELIGGELISFNQHSNISLNPFAQIAGSGVKHAKAIAMLASNYSLIEIGAVTGLSLEQIEMLTNQHSKSKNNQESIDFTKQNLDQKIEILQIGDHFVTKDSIIYAKSIIGAMCGISKDAHKEAIIERAISEGIEKYGNSLDINKLAKVLEELEGATTGKTLAETLYPYSEKGVHGKFFQQGKTASFKQMLTIFEFEEIKNDPVLLAVVLQVVLMQVTMQFLCGDRSKQFLLIVDEAWMILDYSAKFLESFGRTVRKYGGSLVICVQNFTDFQKSNEHRSILENSAWTAILKQDEKGLNSFSSSEAFKDIIPLIESISLIANKYAEILLISTGLKVVGRLMLDPYSQGLYSTEAADFKYLLEARRSGLSKDQALKALAKKYGELPTLPNVENKCTNNK